MHLIFGLFKQEINCTFAHLFGMYLREKRDQKNIRTTSIGIAWLLKWLWNTNYDQQHG